MSPRGAMNLGLDLISLAGGERKRLTDPGEALAARLGVAPGDLVTVATRAGNASGGGHPGWVVKCKGWETDPDAYIYVIAQAQAFPTLAKIIGHADWLDDPNFTVLPTLYGFSPGFGAGGTTVTLTGANFNVGTPSVKFNGVQAATPTGVTFSHVVPSHSHVSERRVPFESPPNRTTTPRALSYAKA